LSENSIITTLTRLLGCCLVSVGVDLFFSPITIIISYLPLFGNFLAALTGFVFFIISSIIGSIISIVTMAVAWIWYRPWVGIGLLLTALIITILFYTYVKDKE